MAEPIKINIEAGGGDAAAEEIHKPAEAVVQSEADIIKAKEEEAAATRKIYEEQRQIAEAEAAAHVEKLKRERELADERRKNRPQKEDAPVVNTKGFGGQLDGTSPDNSARLKEEAAAQEKLNKLIEQEKAAREDLLKKLKEEQAQRQRLQDVQTAKSRLAAKEQEEESALAGAVRSRQLAFSVAGAAIVAVAKASFDETKRLAEAMAEADPEWAREHAFALQSLTALSNPVQTFWDTVTGGARQSVAALQASQNELARTTALLKRMKEEQAQARAAFLDDTIVNQLEAGREASEAMTASLERQVKVLDARRALFEAQARYEDAQALAGGADPNAVRAGAVERGANDQVSRIDQKLAVLERAYREAEENQTRAIGAAAEAANVGSAKATALAAQARKAQAQADKAFEDLQNGKETAALEKQAIIKGAQTELTGVTQQGGEAITSAAKETISALESKAREQGGQLSKLAYSAYDALAKAVSDNIPDSQQTAVIRTAMQQLKSSNEGQGKEVLEGLNSLDISVNALTSQISAVTTRLRALEARVTSPGRNN